MAIVGVGRNGNVMGSELLRCSVVERGMRAHPVIVGTPDVEHGAGLRQRREHRLVQALVAQPADKALSGGNLQSAIGAIIVLAVVGLVKRVVT